MALDIDIEVHEVFSASAGFSLTENLLYAGYGGSKAHNTYVAPSCKKLSVDDVDIICVVGPPLSAGPWRTVRVRHSMWDVHVISVQLFEEFLAVGQVVAFEVLSGPPQNHLEVKDSFQHYFDEQDALATDMLINELRKVDLTRLDVRGNYEGWAYPAERKQLANHFGFDVWAASHLV